MATLETSPEAYCDRQAHRMTKSLIGAKIPVGLKILINRKITLLRCLYHMKKILKSDFTLYLIIGKPGADRGGGPNLIKFSQV